MYRKKEQMVTFVDDESASFVLYTSIGDTNLMATIKFDAFWEDKNALKEIALAANKSVNRLMVVPDYWLGSRIDAFQSRKRSVIAAFIERKLKQDQPTLTEATEFYHYAVVKGDHHRRDLYTYYLQESKAYRLYRRLKEDNAHPFRVTTPALLWQAKLGSKIKNFDEKGIGFIHLEDDDCFLYFFFKGQFLYSRTIQLADQKDDSSSQYDQLNYEINQSFYLFSQKTKNPVDSLFVLASDTKASTRLTASLGREVNEIPELSSSTRISGCDWIPPSCQSFTIEELNRSDLISISYKPLKKELYWRPVQWAGIAVGLCLIVLLSMESVYLQSWLASVDQQMAALNSAGTEPPAVIFQKTTGGIEKIRQALERQSGSGTAIQTFLAVPDQVSIKKFSLDLSQSPRFSVRAVVHAQDPDTFKSILGAFLDQLNHRLDLHTRPLEEKDVQIFLDRNRENKKSPVYLIQIEYGLS